MQATTGNVSLWSLSARPHDLLPPKPLKHHPVQPPQRLGEAGGCHWFPPAYFLVARTTHRKCTGTHIIKPSRPGDSRWHVGGRASSTTWLLLQHGARHEPDHLAQSHSASARGRWNSWLLALRAADIKMPSPGSISYHFYPNFGWSLCKMSDCFIISLISLPFDERAHPFLLSIITDLLKKN